TGEPKRDNDGNIKYTKVPKQPNGYNASSTNENHYVSFRDALSAYETGKFSGIGFCLVEDDPYIIIDLDDCLYNGELSDKAKAIVDTLGSYTEKSQSGNGLHIVVRGDNLEGFNNQGEGVEMYSKERYFAMTGNVLDDYTTVDDADEMYINYLDDLYRPNKKPINNEPVENMPQTDDDDRLLMKIRNTKVKVDARDFPVLFDKGDISNYKSASDADYALAKILAKHTGNIDQIERLMRNSALYRPEKWDEHPDYLRERTIKNALRDVKGGYGIKSSPEDDFQLYVKNSPDVDLKESLKNRRFEELARLESEWELNNKQGRKPTTISPIRCSVILPEYVDFILFDLEENTRVEIYQPKEGIYTRNTTIIKRVISWHEPKLKSNKADEVIYHLTNRADIKEPTISRYLIPVQNG